MKPPRESLLWKKRLFPELVRLAWPIAVSMLSYSFMTVVDTLFVGRLGAASLAGVAWGGVMAFTLLCFGIGVLRAVKVQIAQSIGAGRPDRAETALTGGLALSVGMGVLAVGMAYAILGLVRAGAASGPAGDLSATYFLIRSWGAPVVLAGFALREARYGVGDSRSPMHAAVVANLAHIPLNAALIFGLGLGVTGAAVATLAAQALELGLLLRTARTSTPRFGALTIERCRELLRIGTPLGVEFFLDVAAFSMLAAVIARMGEVALASHQIAVQLSHFAFLPAIAIAEATGVLAGQAVGADEDRLVLKVARAGLLLNLGYVSACALLLVAGGSVAATAFSPDPAVQHEAARLIRVAALLTVLLSIYAVPRAVLRSVGSERFSATVTVAVAWIFPVPAAYFLGLTLGWGAVGGWLGLCAEVTTGLAILWWKLARGSWVLGASRARERLVRAPAAAPGAAPAAAPPPRPAALAFEAEGR